MQGKHYTHCTISSGSSLVGLCLFLHFVSLDSTCERYHLVFVLSLTHFAQHDILQRLSLSQLIVDRFCYAKLFLSILSVSNLTVKRQKDLAFLSYCYSLLSTLNSLRISVRNLSSRQRERKRKLRHAACHHVFSHACKSHTHLPPPFPLPLPCFLSPLLLITPLPFLALQTKEKN